MSKLKLAPLLGVVLALPAGAVMAQTPPPATGAQTPNQTQTQNQPQTQTQAPPSPQEDKDQPATVGDVVVTARANDVRTSIDSITYSLADDLQATTGSLAEALRNVPSVDVDPQGNVSLRGDGNVTILVDGRPSAILSGPNRADAILQLPADRYARIEVMTNPSAAYSPEGSGGVINLITKPIPAAARGAAAASPDATVTTGSLRLNVGDNGRWNVGASGSRQRGKLTLTGDLSYRYDEQNFAFDRLREQLNPVTGAVTSTTTTVQENDMIQKGAFGRLAAEYRLTEKTMLTGELRANRFEADADAGGLFETRDASGVLTSAYTRDGVGGFTMDGWGATARVLHQFDTSGHEWSNELRYDRNDNENASLNINVFAVPVSPAVYEDQTFQNAQETIGFTSAYTRPMDDGSKVRAGYELSINRPDQDVVLRRGPSATALSPVPGLSNQFEADQTVH
ncbi:TonB-dependent receptor plug domain-containing protein, partial [Brevundimonas sp.]|uniref:TonB-dependent receptor plug domain-containing protein n=1 Tax=Brevundimonas sp. TaxID=1871086 RepID=UPI0028B0C71C